MRWKSHQPFILSLWLVPTLRSLRVASQPRVHSLCELVALLAQPPAAGSF